MSRTIMVVTILLTAVYAPPVRAIDQPVSGVAAVSLTPASSSLSTAEFVLGIQSSSPNPIGRGGRVRIDAPAMFSGGQIGAAEWTIKDQRISGRLVRDSSVLGRFQGEISSTGGAMGVFVMPDGVSIKWEWIPEEPSTSKTPPSRSSEE